MLRKLGTILLAIFLMVGFNAPTIAKQPSRLEGNAKQRLAEYKKAAKKANKARKAKEKKDNEKRAKKAAKLAKKYAAKWDAFDKRRDGRKK